MRQSPPTAAGRPPRNVERVSFCGLPFDRVDIATALRRIIARRADESFAYVVTPNVDHVVRASEHHHELFPLYRNAWLSTCDSRVLAALSRATQVNLPVVTGADLTARLLASGVRASDPITVIGGTGEIVAGIERAFGLRRIHHHLPPMGLDRNVDAIDECADFVVRHPARYVFLAVGSPQQEKVAHAILRRPEATGTGLCTGAALGFAAGVLSRAPNLVQSLGLEWLYRLTQEPGRLWRRYLVHDLQIFPLFAQHLAASHRFGLSNAPGRRES